MNWLRDRKERKRQKQLDNSILRSEIESLRQNDSTLVLIPRASNPKSRTANRDELRRLQTEIERQKEMERERERERERARALERARENEANQRRESGAIQLIGGAALTAVAGFSLWLAGPAILAGALVAGAAAVTVTAIQTSGNVIHSNNARAVAQAHLEYEERREQRQIRMLETWSSRYPQIEYGSDW